MKKTLLLTFFLSIGLMVFGQPPGDCGDDYSEVYGHGGNTYSHYSPNSHSTPIPETKVEFKLYPNPVINYVKIDDDSAENGNAKKMNVYNIAGQMVKSFPVEKGKSYDLSELKMGTYLIQFTDYKDRKIATRRITKTNP